MPHHKLATAVIFAALGLVDALSTGPLPASRGVVSFELAGVLWDHAKVRDGVRSELQTFLRNELQVNGPSDSEPLDAFDELDALIAKGGEFGFALPGIVPIQKEVVQTIVAASGWQEGARADVEADALATWLQSYDSFAEMFLDKEAVATLQALKEKGFACCAVTNGLGDSKRMPSLAPLLDFTLNTFEFTVPPSEGWDVAFQFAPIKYGGAVPWVHVGGAVEGGLVASGAASVKMVALGGDESLKALKEAKATFRSPTATVSSLSELPDLIEGLM
jgi:hypothetical protein